MAVDTLFKDTTDVFWLDTTAINWLEPLRVLKIMSVHVSYISKVSGFAPVKVGGIFFW